MALVRLRQLVKLMSSAVDSKSLTSGMDQEGAYRDEMSIKSGMSSCKRCRKIAERRL